MKYCLIAFSFALLLSSCRSEENEDVVKQADHEGSVEIAVSIEHHEGYDLLKSDYKVWVKNQQVNAYQKVDTLPSLGMTTQTAENEDGDEKQVTIPRDYELYFTAK
jgi:hypothetical protein